MLDDSAQYDVMAIDRGWLDLWSQNVIWVEYDGRFEMEQNKVLRLELQRISVFERMASSFLSSDP